MVCISYEQLSLDHVLRLPTHIKERLGEAMKSEITSVFDNDTFALTERHLPADEIIPIKLPLKSKLNSYGP